MSYRIKFIESVVVDGAGNANINYISPAFSDGPELDQMASNWKEIGLKAIESIEITGKNKLDHEKLINKFYNESTIRTDKDFEKKEMLLSKYGKAEKVKNEKEKDSGLSREVLYEKAKQLVDEGKLDKMPAKNVSTEKLAEIVNI
ncbi:MAG: hypothetical protein ACOC10_05025 [Bacteroidota bacterium]